MEKSIKKSEKRKKKNQDKKRNDGKRMKRIKKGELETNK